MSEYLIFNILFEIFASNFVLNIAIKGNNLYSA